MVTYEMRALEAEGYAREAAQQARASAHSARWAARWGAIATVIALTNLVVLVVVR